MKKYLLSLLLLLPILSNAFVIDQGNIDLSSVTASRSSGYAPLGVSFDATGITSVGVTTTPFLDIECRWKFGDPTSGNWGDKMSNTTPVGSAGTGANLSRDVATGGFVSHVFETPGTYKTSVTCTDGANNTALRIFTTTVCDPDNGPNNPVSCGASVFATTNTVCIAANSLPVAGVGGCPAGATVINATASYGSASFPSALSATITGPNKRVLFKRGDTFVSNTMYSLSQTGPGIIGAYGAGANPIIAVPGGGSFSAILSLGTSVNTNANKLNDWRIMDLEFDGGTRVPCISPCTSPNLPDAVTSGGTFTNILFLRGYFHDTGYGFRFSGSGVDTLNFLDNFGLKTTAASSVGDTIISIASLSNNGHPLVNGMGIKIGNNIGTIVSTNAVGPTVTITPAITVAAGNNSTVNFWNLPLNPSYNLPDLFYMQDSTVFRNWRQSGGILFFVSGTRFALMGSLFDNSESGEHVYRSQGMNKSFYSHNQFSDPGQDCTLIVGLGGTCAGDKWAFTQRSFDWAGSSTLPPGTYSEYMVISDNKFIGSSNSNLLVSSTPQNSNMDERRRYLVFERNLFRGGSRSGILTMDLAGLQYSTIRNNVFDCTVLGGSCNSFITVSSSNDYPSKCLETAFLDIYNNVGYFGPNQSGITKSLVSVTQGRIEVHDLNIKNNLLYANGSSASSSVFINCSAPSGCTAPGAPNIGVAYNVPYSGTAGWNNPDSTVTTLPPFVSGSPLEFLDFQVTCHGTSTYPCGRTYTLGDKIWYDGTLLKLQGPNRDLGAFGHQ